MTTEHTTNDSSDLVEVEEKVAIPLEVEILKRAAAYFAAENVLPK